MPRWTVRLAMFLRSFAIQGSWNFRTLIGTGFAFALLPALRAQYRGRPAELEAAALRHSDIFNSHPYLAGVALGSVSRMEAEAADPRVIERFKSALRGPLGSLGDALVWAGWRPVCALLGITVVFAGAPWWAGPALFLAAYNAGHLALRIWGFRIGFRHGRNVGVQLRKAHLARAQHDIAAAGAFVLGILLILLIARGAETGPVWIWAAAGALLTALGLRFGSAARLPVVLALAVLVVVGLVRGLLA